MDNLEDLRATLDSLDAHATQMSRRTTALLNLIGKLADHCASDPIASKMIEDGLAAMVRS
jgi:hypothetical protein